MADINIVELSGRLVRDLKLGESKVFGVYGIITVIVRSQREKKSDFIEVFIWNKRIIEYFGLHLKAGKKVIVRGSLSKSEKNLFVNVNEDYGVILCYDVKDFTNSKDLAEEWIRTLESQNTSYEQKLKSFKQVEESQTDNSNADISTDDSQLIESDLQLTPANRRVKNEQPII